MSTLFFDYVSLDTASWDAGPLIGMVAMTPMLLQSLAEASSAAMAGLQALNIVTPCACESHDPAAGA